jgi:hypothetical protein
VKERIYTTIFISFAEAVLGISKDIEAINGKVRIKKKEFNLVKIQEKEKGINTAKTEIYCSCKCLTQKH